MAPFSTLLLSAASVVAAAGEAPTRIALDDLSLVVTTDIHSWIEGREHEPHLNATLGHAISFFEQLKSLGRQAKKDVFFFDNGDINDGTGLSAVAHDHVAYLGQLMHGAPYDALNLGNYELYTLDGHGSIGGAECPIVGLRDSGYIARWKGRYLTSNVVWADTAEPVGNRFRVVEGEFGTKVLVFGFLYNMPDHCAPVNVENVSEVVKADWFLGALRDHGAQSDAVVVLFHVDYQDELIEVVLRAIRAGVGEKKPVQVLAGHSHLRGWRRLDGYASAYEPGCKLDTLGFVSFSKTPRTEGEDLGFSYTDLDGNTAILAEAANVTDDALLTPLGKSFLGDLKDARHALGLDKPLGCAGRHYSATSAPGNADSLWTYYMSSVVPGALFDQRALRPQWSIVGTGALIYDIYPGPFTKDDAYMVSPFGNFWYSARDVGGATLSELTAKLNARGGPSGRRLAAASQAVPAYVASSTPRQDASYDVIYCDFDAEAVEAELKQLSGGKLPAREVYRPTSNTSSILVDWFKSQPCHAGASSGPRAAIFA